VKEQEKKSVISWTEAVPEKVIGNNAINKSFFEAGCSPTAMCSSHEYSDDYSSYGEKRFRGHLKSRHKGWLSVRHRHTQLPRCMSTHAAGKSVCKCSSFSCTSLPNPNAFSRTRVERFLSAICFCRCLVFGSSRSTPCFSKIYEGKCAELGKVKRKQKQAGTGNRQRHQWNGAEFTSRDHEPRPRAAIRPESVTAVKFIRVPLRKSFGATPWIQAVSVPGASRFVTAR
jgi:hypothetical protein